MAAGKYSFTIEQGSTVDFVIIYKDSNGVPVDLSTYNSKTTINIDNKSLEIYYLSDNDIYESIREEEGGKAKERSKEERIRKERRKGRDCS